MNSSQDFVQRQWGVVAERRKIIAHGETVGKYIPANQAPAWAVENKRKLLSIAPAGAGGFFGGPNPRLNAVGYFLPRPRRWTLLCWRVTRRKFKFKTGLDRNLKANDTHIHESG